MKPLQKISDSWSVKGLAIRNEPYLILNIFFAGVILLIIGYSGIFSPDHNNYPVVCIHQKLTGKPCFSCGLSHSLSLIVRGRIAEAAQWNIYGMRVFLFFVAQLILRIVFSFRYLHSPVFRNKLIVLDSAGSAAMFLITFWPFIMNIIEGFLKAV